MKTFARLLLVVAALVGSFREAGAAACRATCPMDVATAAEATACAAACTGSEAPTACPLPCDPVVPCPLLEPAPPVVFEKSNPARVVERTSHEPIGPHTLLPDGVLVPCDVALAPQVPGDAPPGVSPTRPRLASLWLVDRALLI